LRPVAAGLGALEALGDVVFEAGVADFEVDGFVVVDEVRGEAFLGGGVAVQVRADAVAVVVGPLRADGLPDAFHAEFLLEVVGAVAMVLARDDSRQFLVSRQDGVPGAGVVLFEAVDEFLDLAAVRFARVRALRDVRGQVRR